MIFGDLNLGIDEFFVGMTGPINPAAVFMIQYDRKKGNTREELQKMINEIGCTFQIVDNSTRWCAYAQKWAYEHDFDLIHATSFAYMVSLFMTGMGISAGTEAYLKEEKLELDFVDFLNKIKGEISPEEDQVRNMFECIVDVYMNHISEYEYATERLSFKLTPSEMKKFQEVDGKNNKEKFKILLNQI